MFLRTAAGGEAIAIRAQTIFTCQTCLRSMVSAMNETPSYIMGLTFMICLCMSRAGDLYAADEEEDDHDYEKDKDGPWEVAESDEPLPLESSLAL